MLFQCKACGPATDHGSAPKCSNKAKKPWRTIDIHCHCMVPEANAMVLKATGIPGGGETPNANAHVNALTRSIQPQRGKIDFPKLTDLDTRLADMDRDGIDVQMISPYPGHFVYAAPPEVARDSCHMVNDHIAGMVAKHPDRLMPTRSSLYGGYCNRKPSGRATDSTWITRAPKFARYFPMAGPAA